MPKPKSEIELCNTVKAANLFPGFTLHEEVGTDMNGNSCDMVYEHGSAVYCIEAKLNFNFEVVAQALRWKDKATASFVAVPRSTFKSIWDSPKIKVVMALGLGVIAVEGDKAYFPHPYLDPFEEALPEWEWTLQTGVADMEFWGKIFTRIGENKAAAGSQHGERSTPFTRSIEALKAEAKVHPELSLKELVQRVEHHWCSDSSAAAALYGYAKRGIVPVFWNALPKKK